MTLMQRIGRAGQRVDAGWDDADVERVWQGMQRKRRRRAIATGVAAVSIAGAGMWALLVRSDHGLVVGPAARSTATVPANRGALVRFADGSTAVPSEGHQASLAVVDDNPKRVVVALARGGARFDVVPRHERVFSVRAGDVTISVLGTAFSVERVADRVGVTVTRGAVLVDWGVGTRRLAAGEDGWFPPLVVSPSTIEEPAKPVAKEAPPARHGTARSDVASPRPAARNEAGPPPEDGATGEVNGAARLLADADRARLAGRYDDGAALLRRLLREHPGDQRAPIAAFSLGRVLLGELARPAEAARAFEQARALAPDGPLAEDALAREAEAWSRAGDAYRAQARAAEYLRAYPNGRRAAAMTDAARSTR
jgi:transmembrane sensor